MANSGEGIIEDSGIVNFQISYDAILFLPFRNEVMDATVTHVNQLGFYAQVGPLQVLTAYTSRFSLHELNINVAQVFITRHAMPDDVTTYNMETQMWISDDQEIEIKAGSGVRLRIMNTSVGATDIRAIGTIKEDYLGLISTE